MELWPECAGEQWCAYMRWLAEACRDVESTDCRRTTWEDAAALLMSVYWWTGSSLEHWQAWRRHWPRVTREFMRNLASLDLEVGLGGGAMVAIWCEKSEQWLGAWPEYDLPQPAAPVRGMRAKAAQYAGTCYACGELICVGDMQHAKKIGSTWVVWHEACLTTESLDEATKGGGRGRDRRDDEPMDWRDREGRGRQQEQRRADDPDACEQLGKLIAALNRAETRPAIKAAARAVENAVAEALRDGKVAENGDMVDKVRDALRRAKDRMPDPPQRGGQAEAASQPSDEASAETAQEPAEAAKSDRATVARLKMMLADAKNRKPEARDRFERSMREALVDGKVRRGAGTHAELWHEYCDVCGLDDLQPLEALDPSRPAPKLEEVA